MIKLPTNVNFQGINLLFDYLEGSLPPTMENDIEIDFQTMRFYDMASIVGLISKLFYWGTQTLQHDAQIHIHNIEQATPFRYMQRMDFFTLCGIDIEEKFNRHKSRARFVEISKITGSTDTATLSTQIADCLAPDEKEEVEPERSGCYDSIEYSVSELINNVKQHSCSYGFIGAQVYPETDTVQIAISDIGIGIRQSFIDTGSPYYNQVTTDQAAIELALQPKVSSKMHGQYLVGGAINAGVGLSLLNKLTELVVGDFIVISGNSCYHNGKWITLSYPYKGTFVCFSFKKKALYNFNTLLEQAKVDSGLDSTNDEDILSIFK